GLFGARNFMAFVWNAYSHEHMGNIVVPNEILQHRLTWSAIVPLISFECIEWHASDRVKGNLVYSGKFLVNL
ncbi:hypothetical protein HN873_009100, partial [Arachis hypogaea]